MSTLSDVRNKDKTKTVKSICNILEEVLADPVEFVVVFADGSE
jgi:hypothetical protein